MMFYKVVTCYNFHHYFDVSLIHVWATHPVLLYLSLISQVISQVLLPSSRGDRGHPALPRSGAQGTCWLSGGRKISFSSSKRIMEKVEQILDVAGFIKSHCDDCKWESLEKLSGRWQVSYVLLSGKRTISVQLVTQSCPTLCDPVDCSMPGLPVHHQLPELAQTHDYQVSDAIQPSHPLPFPSPPAFNLSQHQSLSLWVSFLHHVAEVLEFQLQHQSFQWIFRTDLL